MSSKTDPTPQPKRIRGSAEGRAKGAFRPGFDARRNLKGRPPIGESLADLMREYLGETAEVVINNRVQKIERKKALIARIYSDAMAGVTAAQKLLYNYFDGLPEIRAHVAHYEEPYPAGEQPDDEFIERELALTPDLLRKTAAQIIEHNGNGNGKNGKSGDHR